MLPAVEEATVAAVNVKLLQRRMGHLESVNLMQLQKKEMVRDRDGGSVEETELCHGLDLGRYRVPTVDVIWRAAKQLELVHAELGGPMRGPSWGGAPYLLDIVDDFSRRSWVILLKKKSEVTPRVIGSPLLRMKFVKSWLSFVMDLGGIYE